MRVTAYSGGGLWLGSVVGGQALETLVALYVGAAALGLAGGVVVNWLADRVAGDEEPPWRAGDCLRCGAALPAMRLWPLANIAPARRRCAQCGLASSWRRPALELALAAILPLLLARLLDATSAPRIAALAVFAIDTVALFGLAYIFAVDLEHRLIFDIAVYPLVVALPALALLVDRKALAAMLFGVLICGGLFLALYLLGFLLYRVEALGFGDVKLAVLLGIVVGWPSIVTALVLTALFGAAVSLLLLGTGSAQRRTFIPYGVFMTVGATLALLLAAPYW